MRIDRLQCPVDDGQRAQTEKVELDQAGRLDVVLIELRHQVASVRFAIQGAEIGQITGCDDHAAGMLAGVACQSLQLSGHIDQLRDLFVLRIGLFEVFALRQRLFKRHADLERHHLGHTVGKAIGMTENAAHVAHHRFGRHRAEGDDLRDGIAAILARDVVDHMVTSVHAEIDIEIRHGHTLGVKKPLEQQIVLERIKIGDLQRISNQRTGA